MKLPLTTIFFLILLEGHCQIPIKPGSPIIRNDLIRSSHCFYKAFMADSTGRIIYEWVNDQVIRIDSTAGRITFARSRQVPVGSYFTDTSVTDMTFKPLTMHEVHYQRNVNVEMKFDDTNVSVHILRKGVPADKIYPMKSGYFEDNMIEYLYGYLDLKKGEEYTLDNFNKDTPSPSDPVKIEYAFDDIWPLGDGAQVNCRVLHFSHGTSAGYIWIDKVTRLMIKETGNHPGGIFSITRM